MEKTKGRQFTRKGEPMSKFVSQLSKDAAAAQGDLFLLLRNKTRLRIIDLLSRYGGLLCVVEIADVLDEQPATVSNHLATLRAGKLVSREMHGTYAYYSLNAGALDQYHQFLAQLTFLPEGVVD
jgi:DNA-binding transcriptional ArsR family regulator